MWFSDLLRKISSGLRVGETFRNYIGCYLYGIETGEEKKVEYLGAPATLEQLDADVCRYLEDFLSTQHDTTTPAAEAVKSLLEVLPARIRTHLQTDMKEPFISLDGTGFFIRTGMRQRLKEKGRYIE